MARMTKALALVSVALSAAGCMTVPGSGPGTPGAVPSPNRAPDPADVPGPADKDAPPRPVQAPVKEALSQLPDRGEGLTGGVPRQERATPARAQGDRTAAGAHAPERPREPRPRRPAPPREAPARDERGGGAEGLSGTLRPPASGPSRNGNGNGTGVCELGEAYGRWDPRSEQARICRAAYGG